MRRVRIFWLTLLLALATVPVVTTAPAHACVCYYDYTFEEAIEAADLIADVTIREKISFSWADSTYTYDVVVHSVWKGEESRQIKLETKTTPCGSGVIRPNSEFRLWVTGEDGTYHQGNCDFPAEGQNSAELLTQALGEPTDLTGEPVSMRRSWVLAGIGLPFLILGTGLVVWLVQPRFAARSGHR